jgi:hypothetical protein
MPTPQHEAPHRIFTHDKQLIGRTLNRVFGLDIEALTDVSIINTDYTAEPGGAPAPHGDSALLGEFLVEGKAEAIAVILEDRGIALADDDRGQILACTDQDILSTWLHRALRVTAVRELFAD